jgi:DNA topoisomerase-1
VEEPTRDSGKVLPSVGFEEKNSLMASATDSFEGCLNRLLVGNNFILLRKPQSCSDYVRSDDGRWFYHEQEIDDEKLISRLNGMRIPPSWRNVVVAADPDEKIQAIGLDKAGRWQYRYSEKHIQEQARKKFDRIKSFSRDMPIISKKVDDDIARGEPKAFLLRLEEKTGIRAGSERDFKARKKAYGLTTLQNEHAIISGNTIKLNFTAKEGKDAFYEINDELLAQFIKDRKKITKPGEQLFFDIKANDLNKYLKEIAGNDNYSLKDYRTYFGTKIAWQELKQYAGKTYTKKERQKIVKQVSEKVSDFLHNTPSMAKKSYIDPMVWEYIGGLP